MAHVDAQIVATLHIGWSPDFPQQLAVRQHLAWVGSQSRQQSKLDGRDVNRLTIAQHPPLRQIDVHLTKTQNRATAGFAQIWYVTVYVPAAALLGTLKSPVTGLNVEPAVAAVTTVIVTFVVVAGFAPFWSFVSTFTVVAVPNGVFALSLSASMMAMLAALALLLVTVSLLAPVVPVIATAGYILSLFAALGTVTAIFQFGWFSSLFGVHDPGPVLSFAPIIIMGVLFGLGIMWMAGEILHKDKTPDEQHKLTLAHALSRIDLSSLLFFVGILLAVATLEHAKSLQSLAGWLDRTVGRQDVIVLLLGLLSAIVDNVPLVAASMGMYPLSQHPTDSFLWEFMAYCAGTGGSILIIGSAAGVAAMGIEKIQFIWYMRRIAWLALLGYFAGAGVYVVQFKLMH